MREAMTMAAGLGVMILSYAITIMCGHDPAWANVSALWMGVIWLGVRIERLADKLPSSPCEAPKDEAP